MMKKLLPLIILFLLINIYANGQDDVRSICIKINGLNTRVLNGSIKRTEAAKEFKQLIGEIKGIMPINDTWIFPLQGYKTSAIGGINGNGYSDEGYNYLDGNKHTAHPAHDIFINDKNQDALDDKTGKPVSVLAVDDGVIIACNNEWEPTSAMRGGKFIWVYHIPTGTISYYAHNQAIFVQPGDAVKRGQKIAEVGRTGFSAYKKRSPTHLHFSAFKLKDGFPVPYNPYQKLKQSEKR